MLLCFAVDLDAGLVGCLLVSFQLNYLDQQGQLHCKSALWWIGRGGAFVHLVGLTYDYYSLKQVSLARDIILPSSYTTPSMKS